MKQRLISAVVGLAILAVVLLLFNTIALNIVVAAIGLLAVWELLHATGCTKFRLLTVLSMGMAAVIPFLNPRTVLGFFPFFCYAFVLALFGILIRQHEQLHVEKLAMAFMISLIVPFAVYVLVYIRDHFDGGEQGLFYIVVALGAAWFTDSGAYFIGRAFGRHKMAPKVSPNKTVEGAVGGVVICVLCLLLVSFGYGHLSAWMGQPVQIHYGNILLGAPVAALAGILGDLSASVIKRQYGVKDYGHIMPGHGGVMDRFDSVLFVLPMMLILIHFLPFATVL